MECKNCGADVAGRVCEYCGSSLPEPAKQPGNVSGAEMPLDGQQQTITINTGGTQQRGFAPGRVFLLILFLGFLLAASSLFSNISERKREVENTTFWMTQEFQWSSSWQVGSAATTADASQGQAADGSTKRPTAAPSRNATTKRQTQAPTTTRPTAAPTTTAPKPKNVTLTLPKTPIVTRYVISSIAAQETVITQTTINKISYERMDARYGDKENDVRVKIKLSCKKTFDWKGEEGAQLASLRLMVKNSAGDIVQTHQLTKLTVSVNQVFELECTNVLTAGETYTVEIGDFRS